MVDMHISAITDFPRPLIHWFRDWRYPICDRADSSATSYFLSGMLFYSGRLLYGDGQGRKGYKAINASGIPLTVAPTILLPLFICTLICACPLASFTLREPAAVP